MRVLFRCNIRVCGSTKVHHETHTRPLFWSVYNWADKKWYLCPGCSRMKTLGAKKLKIIGVDRPEYPKVAIKHGAPKDIPEGLYEKIEEVLMWVRYGPYNEDYGDRLLEEFENNYGLVPRKKNA